MLIGDVMKKIIIFLFVITCMLFITKKDDHDILKSNNLIRFRIIAPSNSMQDQALKLNIRDALLDDITQIENNSTNIEDTRVAIKKQIPSIEEKLNNYNISYTINYGNNYFPEKEYRGITYPSKEYESLVINLGEGNGDNWWCILFPPLCLIEAQKDDISEVKYDLYINKILSNYQ
jgi:stage II sporulation protein R